MESILDLKDYEVEEFKQGDDIMNAVMWFPMKRYQFIIDPEVDNSLDVKYSNYKLNNSPFEIRQRHGLLDSVYVIKGPEVNTILYSFLLNLCITYEMEFLIRKVFDPDDEIIRFITSLVLNFGSYFPSTVVDDTKRQFVLGLIYISTMDHFPAGKVYRTNCKVLCNLLYMNLSIKPFRYTLESMTKLLNSFRKLAGDTIKCKLEKHYISEKKATIVEHAKQQLLNRLLADERTGKHINYILSKLKISNLLCLYDAVGNGTFDPKMTQMLIEVLGIEYDSDINMYFDPITRIKKKKTTANIPKSASQPVPSAPDEDYSCAICAANAPNTVFLPCKHMCCDECFPKLNECHMCKAMIESTLKVYT
jgi:hypothetical protein